MIDSFSYEHTHFYKIVSLFRGNDDGCSIDMMIVLCKQFNISIGFYGSLCGTNTATNDANRSLRYLLIAGLGMLTLIIIHLHVCVNLYV
jgi:hypothetical protein